MQVASIRRQERDQGELTTGTDGLEALYREHAHVAARLAFLLTGDTASGEDLVQEAFIRVAGKSLRSQDPLVFRAYLRRTIINLHTSAQRRRGVERKHLKRQAAEPPSPFAPPDIDTQDEMWRLLGALPPRQRAALVLRYYEDLSEEDTASALGCSRSAARSLAARGLDTLRQGMREEQDDA